MKTEELTVDLSLHQRLGMTILTSDEVRKRQKTKAAEEWPENSLFEPKGVTVDDACAAMKCCIG